MSGAPLYLFSVDVEDPRLALAGGEGMEARVPALVETYLDFLRRHGARGTFFVVGEVARRHPGTIRRIVEAGHELGCHSDAHLPIERQDRSDFRDDLLRSLEALRSAGAEAVPGYRAPFFSLTAERRWAYEVLAELGFAYSSSVLPAPSPRYGWPGFGPAPRLVGNLVELPVTLLPIRLLPVPVGGLYFRIVPRFLLRRALRRLRDEGAPVLSYHHPYDIDTVQSFTHAEFRRFGLFDLLMRANRKAVLPRLDMAARLGFAFAPYGPFAERARATLERGET